MVEGSLCSPCGSTFPAGQHIALHEPPKEDHIGLICTRCSPVNVAHDAISDARSICLREYGAAPDVVVYGNPDFTFPYVPSHLHHMVFELVKNSLRAVQDKYEDADEEPPPIRYARLRVWACVTGTRALAAACRLHVLLLSAALSPY
jgi:pyruvate dehydrogenase kinase 2/3/4